jgi:hypothetical protein
MAVQRWIVKQPPTREEAMESILLDVAGHRRSPATMPGSLVPIGEDGGSCHGQGARASWRNFGYSLAA